MNKNCKGSRGICKHTDLSGDSVLKKPYYPQGTIDGKVINSNMAKCLSFYGKYGSSCNRVFSKTKYLEKHPEYSEWRNYLEDLPNQPWTKISPINR